MKLIELLNFMHEDEFLTVNIYIGGVLFSACHAVGTFSSCEELCQKQVVTIYSGDDGDPENKIILVKIQN